MNKLAWLTDVHLNFLTPEKRVSFYQRFKEQDIDAVLITGDIAETPNLGLLLTEFSTYINKTIYFVLGNHDYYHDSVKNVHKSVLDLCEKNNLLHWLGKPELIKLSDKEILIGLDGWADARYGNFASSPIQLSDRYLIEDLVIAQNKSPADLQKQMQELADADVENFAKILDKALRYQPKKMIIATHIPPFAECCRYHGLPSHPNWYPFLSSKATGDLLSQTARQYPQIQFLVLCGHTHMPYRTKISNLEIWVGKAEYAKPELQEIIG